MNNITLNDKNIMPQLGFGLWQVPDDEAETVVSHALKVGYRSIDSAQIYQNEAGLGRAIKKSNIHPKDLFITTKIWNDQQGFDLTRKSFDESMKKLGLEKLDLLLIHWPSPKRNLYVDTWKALIELKKENRVSSIGVSNFTVENLKRIMDATSVVPVVNQIELHPHFQQHELVSFHSQTGIKTECWSPLGQGKDLNDPTILEMAKKYNKTPAQIILRWHLDQGYIAIPKSVTPSRIEENFKVTDFRLDDADHAKMKKLDRKDGRIGPNPDTAEF